MGIENPKGGRLENRKIFYFIISIGPLPEAGESQLNKKATIQQFKKLKIN